MPREVIGRWRLIEMEQWDRELIDLVEPGFISFTKGGRGEMRFGAVILNLDWETGHDGKAEFSFEGFDELDEVSGRGWAKTIAARLTGGIRFHQGEKSGFTATPWSRSERTQSQTPPDIMKVEDMRRRLQEMRAEDLRIVVARLYKMLPKKVAKERAADRLINDPQAFLKSVKVTKLPALPDIDLLEVETAEFIENAKAQHYFAPNRIISKSQRGKWRFVAKQLYTDWCLLAVQPENFAPAAKALEDLYRILCRGCEVYLFPSTDTFRAIGVSQPEFLEQILQLCPRLCPPNEWIPKALSLLDGRAYGDTTTTQLQDVFIRTLKTTDLKELAIEVVSRQLDRRPTSAFGSDREQYSGRFDHRPHLLRLGFQISWALGEKEQAVRWLRTRTQPESDAGHLIMRLLLETKDREVWMREYEMIRLEQPPVAEQWSKTFEQAQSQGQLPAWQV